MGGRTVSPGGALLRGSRMFSLPQPLPAPQSQVIRMSDAKSPWGAERHPLHQSIVSPLSSREKGDWGLKRPLPLKTTMATTTPVIRVRQIDCIENVTDFSPASEHTLTLEKFQEMRVPVNVPVSNDFRRDRDVASENWGKSVFEEHMDFTTFERGKGDDRRWKFSGPWLAKMNEGEFIDYVQRKVRPKRAEFRQLLKRKLAEELTVQRSGEAREKGEMIPPPVKVSEITDAQFTSYLRTLRNNRITLYALISKFLDLAPLGQPIGFHQSILQMGTQDAAPSNPYGKSGPPPSHPSGGIGYLRTGSVMENHPVYGPQERRAPVQARILSPRTSAQGAKLGVGGFVAPVPQGDSRFGFRMLKGKMADRRSVTGLDHLDISTYGGAKAYVEPHSATISADGKVILKVRDTTEEAQLVFKETKGQSRIYHEGSLSRTQPSQRPRVAEQRMRRVADEVVGEEALQSDPDEKEVVGSSQTYGLS